MTKDKALKRALEVLEWILTGEAEDQMADGWDSVHETLAKIKEVLAQPEQEPVAWKRPIIYTPPHMEAQSKHEWVGLTDDEVKELVDAFYGTDIHRLKAIEAKLKEKNHD